MMRNIKSIVLLFLFQGFVFAQDSIPADTAAAADSLSAAAKQDSAAAAYKWEALRQALGDDYQPPPPITDDYQPPSLGNIAIRMFIGLGVILVLLYVLYILAKKVRKVESPLANNGQSAIQLLDTKFLGSGKNIFLIKAGTERVLVVGSYPEGMRTLSEIQGEEAKYIMEAYGSKPVNAAQFSATVDHLLRRFKKEGGA